MTERAVVDTGPLVALIRAGETAHEPCVVAARNLRAPLLSCWPVLTEAAWLLRREPGGVRALGRLVQSGAVELAPLDDVALAWIVDYVDRYASAGAQLADAALVYLAEREGIDCVFTLDRRDFAIYRTTNGRALRVVP